MDKLKRIAALVGVILLVCLYAGTLIFALIGSELTDMLFHACIAGTILIPTLIYLMIAANNWRKPK